jgi:hypothetical protein
VKTILPSALMAATALDCAVGPAYRRPPVRTPTENRGPEDRPADPPSGAAPPEAAARRSRRMTHRTGGKTACYNTARFPPTW